VQAGHRERDVPERFPIHAYGETRSGGIEHKRIGHESGFPRLGSGCGAGGGCTVRHHLVARREAERHRALIIGAAHDDARRRLHTNPLRILDTKNPAMQPMVQGAPRLIDFLGPESLAHFNGVKAMLEANGIAYTVNPRLVRGMDYYNLTVFEFVTDSLGAQGTICAGGRYDDLIAQIGGKPAPAVGWALGVERVLELLREQGAAIPEPVPDAYAIVPDAAAMPVVLHTLQALRAAGLKVQMHAASAEGLGSMKSQFKKADASGARHALIFGADELAAGDVTVKSLRDGAGAQERRPLAAAAQWASGLKD
jgi:histidyl-tRNA synthetase